MSVSDPVSCKSCNMPIVFIDTPAGRKMPADAVTVTVVLDDGTVVQARLPHWASCSGAYEHRRPRT